MKFEDTLVVAVACNLVLGGNTHIGAALMEHCTLRLTEGSSWSDGHDGYIYDLTAHLSGDAQSVEWLVRTGCVTDPRTVSGRPDGVLAKSVSRLVSFWPDENGEYRKGDLVGFVVDASVECQSGPEPVAVLDRRRALGEQVAQLKEDGRDDTFKVGMTKSQAVPEQGWHCSACRAAGHDIGSF